MTEHVTLTKVCYRLGDAGITIADLEDMDLFDIVMDLVGFPSKHRKVCIMQSGKETLRTERSKWLDEAYHLELEEIDAFLDKLYKEFDELLVAQSELFAGNR